MPAQKQTASLFTKLGDKAKKAHEAHKTDETRYGIVNLPAGIVGGIAQLKTVKWDEYKPGTKYAGQPYVLFRGIAVEPVQFNNMRIQGQGVMITVPLCDQPDKKVGGANGRPRTFDDNWADLLNEFRKFGIDTAALDYNAVESVMEQLATDAPHFNFSTRGWTPPATKQNPRPEEIVFTQFDGVCDYQAEGGELDQAQDDSPAAEEPTATPASAPSGKGKQKAPPPEPEDTVEEPAAEFDETAGDNLNELAKSADEGDEDAGERLKVLAKEAGLSDKKVKDADNWQEVADLIAATATPEEPAEEEQPAEEWSPRKEDVCLYRPFNAKTKTKAKKPVEVEVMDVDEKAKTVTLKNLDDPKIKYAKVKWDDLEFPETN